MTVGTRVYRLCWPSNVGVVREVKSLAHLPGVTNPQAETLMVEWDDRPGELFEEVPRDVAPEPWTPPAPVTTPEVQPCPGCGHVVPPDVHWSGCPLFGDAAAIAGYLAQTPEATLLRDRLTGRAWLEFVAKPSDEVISALKGAGWRFSGYRKAWHNPRKGVKPPACVRFADGGECEYSAERADRLEARADKARAASGSAMAKATKLADAIPLGQPILVGHHSEKRHRRDVARITRGFETAMEEGAKADRLEQAADASRAHQERMESVPVIMRRIDKLRADLRSIDARKGQWGAEHLADWQAKRDALAAEVERAEAQLAEAGGPIVAECKKGDIIRIRGHVVKVDRVNAKTISGTIHEGGAKGMTGKWDKSWFQGVVTPGSAS